MLVKACLNGGTSRSDHPAVPRSPGELAADAIAVVAAGARAIHFHPRAVGVYAGGADTASGRDTEVPETLDSAWVLPAVAAVHKAVPGTPVGVTTGIWAVNGDPEVRLELVADWTGPDRPDFASINLSEPGAVELFDLLTDLDIAVEAGLWTLADVDALVAAGFGRQALRFLIEPPDPTPEGAVAAAAAINAALTGHGFTQPRVHHGYGLATWPVLQAAIALGQDIRVGLEDTTVLPDGSTTTGNAELVATAIGLARGEAVI
jgi:uncharacterized protein (DUF849 family)